MPPQTPERMARWKVIGAYTALGVFAFVFWLYVTFPYDVVKQRITTEAANAGWTVTMSSLGPGLFGLTANNVRLNKAQPDFAPPAAEGAGPAHESEPLTLPTVSLRPALFPLGVAVRASAFGGQISGAVGGLSTMNVRLNLDDLDPEQGNLKGFSGLDLSGKLNGQLTLAIPAVERPGAPGGPREYDLAKANGSLTLDTKNLLVKGGTITVPMYGTPTPVDLPRIALGDLEGKVKIEDGLATVDTFHGKSADLELQAAGTVKLNRRPDFSELAMDFKIKAEPDFVKRLGLIGSGLAMLGTDKTDPSFRVARLTGFLGRPNFAR